MPNVYLLHRLIRSVAGWVVVSFFTEIHVIGSENVPKHGPLLVTATHHNMILDPAILSFAFPYQRILHYWAKASLFATAIGNFVLRSSGVIPVDRKSHDRQRLFHGSFKAFARGSAVALFPEGTSYTETRIMQVKDGAAWAALEYSKWAREHPEQVQPGAEDLKVVTCAIVYTNKTKYRSQVIMEFGPPISMEPYLEQFLSSEEGAPRAAVKRLTADIEQHLIETTINAPDWDTLYAARMARDLLWEGEKPINLDEFVIISQTLVDLFSTPDLVRNDTAIKRHLLTYYSLLQSSKLTNSELSALPLPRTLDPHRPTPLPSRLFTLTLLIRDTLAVLVRLPFFLIPLLVHAPAYALGRFGARLVEDEEETQAQNKTVFGLLMLFMIYPAAFFFFWAFLWYTPVGALVSAVLVFLFALYHTKLVNDNYEHAKRLVAAWRVLVGVWAPKKWDLSLSALAQYTIPSVPPENPWIDRSKSRPATPTSSEAGSDAGSPARKRRRPPSRRLIRHVLRARIEAAKALSSLFEQLDRDGRRVCASAHLARAHGGWADGARGQAGDTAGAGSRDAREVIAFLRTRGARIAALVDGTEGDWAALSSEGEGDSDAAFGEGDRDDDDVVWVPPGRP